MTRAFPSLALLALALAAAGCADTFTPASVIEDRRVLALDLERREVLANDQQRLQVDAYARYRIIDPVRMVRTARNQDQLQQALQQINMHHEERVAEPGLFFRFLDQPADGVVAVFDGAGSAAAGRDVDLRAAV